MSIDLTYLATLHTDHQTSITRHLIHHPEDEHHPLMALLVEALDSLAYIEDELVPLPPAPPKRTVSDFIEVGYSHSEAVALLHQSIPDQDHALAHPTPRKPRQELACRYLPTGTRCYTWHDGADRKAGGGSYIRQSKPLAKPQWIWCVVNPAWSREDGHHIEEHIAPFRNRDHAQAWHAATVKPRMQA